MRTRYSKANRSLYRHVVCCVQVSCRANGVGNQLGGVAILAILYPLCIHYNSKSNRKAMNRNWSNQKANPALKTKTGNK